MIGKAFLYFGLALIVTAVFKATINMLLADVFDPWSVALAVGCIVASIGMGVTRSNPWKWIEDTTTRLGQPPAQE
jgi:hypothetical protein